MTTPDAATNDVITFGPFSLIASERRLTRNGVPVEISGRAYDILTVLLSRPSEVVSKSDLMAQVWPGITVEEASLRFHIANLRKMLGDGKDGARYISTAAGRGYCLVVPVLRTGERRALPKTSEAPFRHANLPGRLTGMVDRVDDLRKIPARLEATRFVTIVGSGGVGKTTLAVAVGHQLMDAFAGAVLFVDLSMLSDPNLVPTVVASLLGLSVQSDDAMPGLIAYLRDKRILLILDTCEHLVEAVADLAWTIFTAAPLVHILATSRETLQAEGEHVYRLEPLECPPEDARPTAAVARTFPAIQLFVERALASGAQLDFSDVEAATVADMCRKLDGVALAIELAARRVEAYGVHQTAALLGERLTLLWVGLRTAPPRQKTLQATLDWSYSLLSEVERTVLRRLAVFVGHFTLDAALAVVSSATLGEAEVLAAIDGLIAKSMVATRPIGAMMRYRLLDTTRAYALEMSIDDVDAADLAVRHATYFRKWLEENGTEWSTLLTGMERVSHFAGLNNVRAALEWCFGVDGNGEVGVGLAAAAAPVFLAMSLLTECNRWSERAILALGNSNRGGRQEMQLQAALGVSLMFTRGGHAAARLALNRSFAIAEQSGDAFGQLQALGPLEMFHIRTGEFKTALQYAKRCSNIANNLQDQFAISLTHSLMGISLHLSGELGSARTELEGALMDQPDSRQTTTIYLGFESQNLAGAVLGSTLWLQGYPVQAVDRARQTVKDAAQMDHPLTLALALIWATYVFLWIGDHQSAEEHIDRLFSRAGSRSLGPYLAVGRGFRGELAVSRGDVAGGIESLRDCLREFHATPYEVQTTPFNTALARGLAATGQLAEAIGLIEHTIRQVDRNGDFCYMPELLRVKGQLLLSMPDRNKDEAEACFMQSLQWSRRQGARGWELRTATDLATLLADRGERDNGRALLEPVYAQFSEGFDTVDLNAAGRMLAVLS